MTYPVESTARSARTGLPAESSPPTPMALETGTTLDAELSFCANTFVREAILADVPRAYSECEAVEYRTPVPSLQGY